MKIKVELFGVCRELSDQDFINLDFDNEILIKDLRDKMIEIVKEKFPSNDNYLEMVKKSAFSANDEIVGDEFKIKDKQTVSIIPPIGGG
jgi:molybdopterin converting factor small subunit